MDDAAAKALIDVFARQLPALTGGEAIPQRWGL